MTRTEAGADMVFAIRRAVASVRSVFMHGGLNRQIGSRSIVRRAAMNPHSVRELDAKQQNHLQ
jgi:hypothetical protein